MSDSTVEKKGTATGLAWLSDISVGRAVLWMELAVAILLGLSFGIGGWDQAQTDMFNMFFMVSLTTVVMVGFALFPQINVKIERRTTLIVVAILAGCLLLSYSILVYGTGNAGELRFIAASLPGAALAVLGIGLLVVREKLPSRLAGYYSLWIFGVIMMMFMPLNELGVLNYSGRDLLMGGFGLGVSIIGATGFAMERRMARRIEAWRTAGDAKYIAGKFDDALEYYEHALYVEPKNAGLWANSGSAHLRMGMWAKAIGSFDRALDLDPGLAIAHGGRGLALTQLKRYSEALESHDRAITADNAPVNWNNKGNTMARMGAPVADVIECYRKALELDADYEIAWFNKGKAELMNDDLKDAITSFTRAVELKPGFAEAWFHRGRALAMVEGKEQEALYCLDTAIELKPTYADAWTERKILLTASKVRKARPIPLVNIPRSGVVFGPAAGSHPLLERTGRAVRPSDMRLAADSAKLREGALMMATGGNYSGALSALRGRLAKAPNDVVTHMTMGILLSRIGQFDDALRAFDSAVKLKPDWVGPMFGRGMILAAKGDYDGAYAAMDAVTRKRPNYADAWSVKGIILGTQKKYDEAIGCFDRAIEIDPNSEDTWRSKSTALNKLGRYEEAIGCYEKLAALSSDMEGSRRFLWEEREKLEDARTLFGQGVELAKSRLYDEGLLLLRDAMELRPNYVDAIYISGVINGVLGRYPEAMEHFERVLELRGAHVEAMYGKANILLKQGSHAKALDTLDRVLELDPEHADAWCDRGAALVKLGKEAEAVECYDRALKIAGDHPQAIAQRERCVKVMGEAGGIATDKMQAEDNE